MFRVPREYKKKAEFYKYMIVFTTMILLVVLYLGKIAALIGWAVGILFPFILGLGFAFIFNIISNAILMFLHRFFHIKPTKNKRRITNTIAIMIVLGIVAIFLITIVPQVFVSFERLVNNLPATLAHLKKTALRMTRSFPGIYAMIKGINVHTVDKNEILNQLNSLTNAFLGDTKMVDHINTIISTTISWVTTLFLSFAFSIFVLFNKNRFVADTKNFFLAYLPINGYKKGAHIYHIFKRTFTRYIGGTLVECLILGTLVTIGSTILQIPYALLCGFLVSIGALVPMFGAFVVAICCCLFIMIQTPAAGLTFIIMFIAIQQVEGNFIYPNVVGKSVGFPPMYVIVAITLGASIAGVIGMVIFIPLCSSLYQLLQEYEMKRITNKKY